MSGFRLVITDKRTGLPLLDLPLDALPIGEPLLKTRDPNGIEVQIERDEDPCHPCGCPKRFNRHADGCPQREAKGCTHPADEPCFGKTVPNEAGEMVRAVSFYKPTPPDTCDCPDEYEYHRQGCPEYEDH